MAKAAAAGAAGGAAATGTKGKKKVFKKKERKNIPHGVAFIQASFNNTILTITDSEGRTLAWKSSGSLGFRGSRKGTPFAAQQAAMNAANQARDHGMRTIEVRVNGPGSGRESAIRALAAAGAPAAAAAGAAFSLAMSSLLGLRNASLLRPRAPFARDSAHCALTLSSKLCLRR